MPSNHIAMFRRGQTMGSIAPNKICVGASLSSRIFFDQVILTFKVDGSRGLNNNEHFASFYHIINAANYLPLEAEHSSQKVPYVTVSKQMTNQHKQQIKFFPFQRATSLTGDTLLSDLKLFYLSNYIIHGGGAGRVSSKMDVIPLHSAKRHKMGDGLFMECKGV